MEMVVDKRVHTFCDTCNMELYKSHCRCNHVRCLTPCRHVFCETCLARWFHLQQLYDSDEGLVTDGNNLVYKCPTCQKDLPKLAHLLTTIHSKGDFPELNSQMKFVGPLSRPYTLVPGFGVVSTNSIQCVSDTGSSLNYTAVWRSLPVVSLDIGL